MSIIEKNNRLLEENYPQMYELYEAYISDNTKQRQENVYVNEDFAAVVTDREWYFNGRYNPKEAAQIWASQFEKKEGQLYVMAGLGNGSYAKALREYLPESCGLLIYEPCTEIFLQAMENIDLTPLLIGRTAIVADGINKGHIYEYFIQTINYGNRKDIHFCTHPNYDRVFEKQVDWLFEITQNELSMLEVVKNTEMRFSKEFFENMMTNLWCYMSNSTLGQLENAMKPVSSKNVPAVIVAAGPSLDKNIAALKEYKNRAFIIACDSALNPLLKNGIIPDLAISVDPHKPEYYFSQPEAEEIPFVLCLQTISWFRKKHKGRKFYFADNNLSNNMMHMYGKEAGILETSGSVANNAFSVAKTLGFTNIILVGQDLSYDNGTYYAKGVHKNDNIFAMQSQNKGKHYFEIDGYYGGKVVTNDALNFYRTWFEKQIIRYPDINVINSTEGGAMIHGAKNIPLAQALDELCNGEMDFAALLESIAPVFDENEIAKIRTDFGNFNETLLDIKRDISTAIRNYRRLEELVRKGRQGNSEFNNLMEKINYVQERVNTEPLMDLAAMHNRETEYEVLDRNAEVTGDSYRDTIDAIHNGISILESYSRGIDSVIADLPLIYENMN